MLTKLLKAKIHRAVVTMTDVDYHGSITIDSALLDASGLLPNEAVVIADCENGNRFETYIIPGKPGSGVIGINGAAARLSAVGHRVIIMSYVQASEAEIPGHSARIVLMDDKNRPTEVFDQPTVQRGTKAQRHAGTQEEGGQGIKAQKHEGTQGDRPAPAAPSSLRASVPPSLS